MARTSFIAKAFRSRWLLAGVFSVLVLSGLAFGRQYVHNRQIEQDIANLQKQADGLAANNLHISDLQNALQTESYLEREARLKLGLKKPGEHVVVIQDKAAAVPAFQSLDDLQANAATPEAAPEVPNPKRWWAYFFDRRQYEALAAAYAQP